MNELTNIELERELVAQTIASQGEGFRLLRATVAPDDFTNPLCRSAWAAMVDVHDSGATVTVANVYARLSEREGSTAAAQLLMLDRGGTGGDLLRWAVSVAALAGKRRLMRAVTEWREMVADPAVSVEELCNTLADIAAGERGNTAAVTTWSELGTDLLRRAQAVASGEAVTGVRTGFRYIDERGGLKAGNLDIIAGRTSNGKTAMAMAVAVNAALDGTRVAVYSMEMTLPELATRIAAMVSRVPCAQIERGPLDGETFTRLFTRVSETAGAPILFDKNRTADVDKVVAGIRRMATCEGVRVVVLDYIQQLTSTRHRDKRSLVSEVCVTLKNLAVELGITIIALSQLARESPGGNHAPLMSQLKEAGEIENSADNVYMVYRAELYGESFPGSWSAYSTEGTALVINSKARSGAIGEFLVGFDAPCVHYHDRDTVQQPAATITRAGVALPTPF